MTAGRNSSESSSHHWCTPQKYVNCIYTFFDGPPDLDPCSNSYSIIKAKKEYILPENDGLNESWNFKTIFVNPPYGRDKVRKTTIKNWLEKCSESNKLYSSEVLALVPVATNTKHWKQHVFGVAKAVCFLYDTRLKFMINGIEGGKGAPMSCSIIYWGSNYDKFKSTFLPFGAIIQV